MAMIQTIFLVVIAPLPPFLGIFLGHLILYEGEWQSALHDSAIIMLGALVMLPLCAIAAVLLLGLVTQIVSVGRAQIIC